MKKIRKILIIIFLPFLCFYLFSCGTLKKTKTLIITETKIKFDTVIIYKSDTITQIKSVWLTDTAYIENKTSKAKSYFSTEKKKIVLELKGKSFEVPVSIYKQVKVTDVNKVTKRESFFDWKFYLMLFFFLLLLFSGILQVNKIDKKCKE